MAISRPRYSPARIQTISNGRSGGCGRQMKIALDLPERCECLRQVEWNAGLAADGDRLDQELPGVVVPVFASPLMRLLHKIVGCTGHGGSRLSLAPVQLAGHRKARVPQPKANCGSS